MYDLRNPAIDDPLDRVRPQKKEHIVHPSNWLRYNPFYDLFYSTANIATAVAVILLVALFVALARRHKVASIGIGTGLGLAIIAAVVLHISAHLVDQGFDANMATRNYGAPVTGVQFVGTPILMAIAAAVLLGMAGKTTWAAGRTLFSKSLLVATYLLGASLFGTFATSLTTDLYNVSGSYWTIWANLDAYMWAVDFLLACAVLGLGLIVGGRHVHRNISVKTISTNSPYWRRVQVTSKKPLSRTAGAAASA